MQIQFTVAYVHAFTNKSLCISHWVLLSTTKKKTILEIHLDESFSHFYFLTYMILKISVTFEYVFITLAWI